MTINELIDELCAIRDLAPGNGDMPVCTEQEVQLGELDAPMTDLAVDVAWLDGAQLNTVLAIVGSVTLLRCAIYTSLKITETLNDQSIISFLWYRRV